MKGCSVPVIAFNFMDRNLLYCHFLQVQDEEAKEWINPLTII